MKKMYRYIDDTSCRLNFFGDGMNFDYKCKLEEWFIKSETKSTYLLKNTTCNMMLSYTKRMYKNAKNRYAFSTKEEALENYLYRKEYQLNIYKKKIKATEERIKHAIACV